MKKFLFSTLLIISFFAITTPSLLIAKDNNIPDKPLTTLPEYEKTADKNYAYAQQLFSQGQFKKCIQFCHAAIQQYSKLEITTIEDGEEVEEIDVEIDEKRENAKKLKKQAENIPDKPLTTLTEYEKTADKNYAYAQQLFSQGQFKKCILFCHAAIQQYSKLEITTIEDGEEVEEIDIEIDEKRENAKKLKKQAQNKFKSLLKKRTSKK